jgi:hypothetical protein
MLADLKKLTTDQIIQLLEATGYELNDIWDAEYHKVTTIPRSVQYRIHFRDCDGNDDSGWVYVFIDAHGKLACEF